MREVVKLYMAGVYYNNDKHPVPKNFSPLHSASLHLSTLHHFSANNLHELNTSLVLYDPFQISLILLTSDVIQLTLLISQFNKNTKQYPITRHFNVTSMRSTCLECYTHAQHTHPYQHY